MSIALLKFAGIAPVGLMMGYVLKKYKEAEDDLYAQRISWSQYEMMRQSTAGMGVILFLIGMILCSL
jgi:hypothetical protein